MPRRLGFSQTISFRTENPDEVVRLLEEWDEVQSTLDIMGYIGTHVLCDRDEPGHYVIVAEFAAVEPGVSAFEEAQRNNERPETQEWARKFSALIDGEPTWGHYDELYRTDP